jgi:hypothetical protein
MSHDMQPTTSAVKALTARAAQRSARESVVMMDAPVLTLHLERPSAARHFGNKRASTHVGCRQPSCDINSAESTDGIHFEVRPPITTESYLRVFQYGGYFYAETLSAFLTRLRVAADTLDIVERQRLVRLVIKEVLVGDDTVVLRHCIPVPSGPPSGSGPPPSGRSDDLGEDRSYLLRSGSGESSGGQYLSAPRLRVGVHHFATQIADS